MDKTPNTDQRENTTSSPSNASTESHKGGFWDDHKRMYRIAPDVFAAASRALDRTVQERATPNGA